MSKPAAVKKGHWTSRVKEVVGTKDARGELNLPLVGGAEHGEFAAFGDDGDGHAVVYGTDTGAARVAVGDLLLEVEDLAVSGLPLYDVRALIQNCKGPVRLKTVKQGKTRGDIF